MAWGGDEDIPWTGRVDGYLFEPEYTDEEMIQRDSELAAAAAAAAADPPLLRSPPRLGRPGGSDTWCTCGNCEVMETEAMSFCCHECMRMEPLLREMEEQRELDEQPTDGDADDIQVCIRHHEYYEGHLNPGVLDTYFRIPKINWKPNPTPGGPNGTLSNE